MSTTLINGNIMLTGPVFIGVVFNWCLLGTLISQVYVYVLSYPNDSRRLKCLVTVLFLLEIAQTVFSTHYAWRMLVADWGKASFDVFFPWSAATFPIMNGAVSLIVQVYFAWRIWVLRVSCQYSKTIEAMSVLIILVALVQSTAAMYGGFSFWISRTWERVSQLTPIVEVWLGGSLACDVLIAVTMISILTEAVRGSPWKHTAALVNRLIIHSIETGAATAVTALVDLVVFELFKHTNVHQAPTLLLGKLYTNALMVSLNGRQHRRDDLSTILQQSALSHLRIQPNHSEDHEPTLRSSTSHQHYRDTSKDTIVIQVSECTDGGNNIAFSQKLDSPV